MSMSYYTHDMVRLHDHKEHRAQKSIRLFLYVVCPLLVTKVCVLHSRTSSTKQLWMGVPWKGRSYHQIRAVKTLTQC